ncbi:HNH endonuclease [Heyndrickxia coagulans]|uniref:HNH domain-containing protein n=1 Tax=Heyndrickxia coagulans TaxID=1398 RepID=A0A150K5G0_HEYCO|nr:HNH endonuclease signature motif containing protein [Heyndrickxia coagulans]KYC64712.1 hypothetical protein B4098_3405 [Heyndrickxia coagulans]
MKFEYRPYSKAKQLGKKPVKRKGKKRHGEMVKGRKIPSKTVRGRITKAEYIEALRRNGDCCYICGTTLNLEAHHVRFRSAGGRGKWRNIRFLCAEHHRGKYSPHRNEQLRKELEKLHEKLYGPWFWADKYDLFKAGLIPNTTDEEFEKFMKGEEKS